MNMDERIAEWVTWMRASKGRAAGTLAAYERVVRAFCAANGIVEPSQHFTSGDVERWVQRPRVGRAQGRVAEPATQNRDACALRSFFGWLDARGERTGNPAKLASTPPIHNRQPRPISDDTWLGLWRRARVADSVALGLMYVAGLRRFELTALTCSQVDLGARRLVNFARKGGGEHSLHVGTMIDVHVKRLPDLDVGHLWDAVVEVVGDRPGREPLLRGVDLVPHRVASMRELVPQDLNHWLNDLCGSQREHVTPHQLRHSCATNLIRAGVPIPIVSNLLNHANIHTTMRYVKASGDELGEWLARS